ncbi:hypothetical protein DFP72DRAFT_1067959 [Ephemerocybe angulata]|uniref:DUF6589 domain-containing protein n=1 Tax=Ephemerocybe angulata TaxID=980116 RepID=A0A8H6M7T2_9AGAR|nr:hypothetical protein DFP72DRAFT_1067959 [Tulosesus angulatus]
MSTRPSEYTSDFWSARLGKKFKKIKDEDKYLLVISLMGYLDVGTLKFLEFFFTSDDYNTRVRSGTFMGYDSRKNDEERRFAPAVIYKAWHDNDNIIRDKSLKIKTNTLTQDSFDETLAPGMLIDTYKNHAPFMWSLLEVFSASPNAARKRKMRKAQESGEAVSEAAPDSLGEQEEVDEDIDEEQNEDMEEELGGNEDTEGAYDDEITRAFTGGLDTPAGFSRNPLFPVLLSISMTTFARNRATNALPMLMGLFFKVEGTSSRVMKLLSNVAMCISTRTAERIKERVSANAIEHAASLVNSGNLFFTVADNINLYLRKYQQRLTNRNYMIHATNSAILRVNSDGINIKKATDLKERLNLRGGRKEATFADIRPSKEDSQFMNKAMPVHIANLIVQYTPGSKKWRNRREILEKVKKAMPSEKPIPVEKTDTRPFGIFDVNEGSKKGLIELLAEIRERTGMTEEEWAKEIRVLSGYWLTSNNFRHARRERADDKTGYHRLEYVQELSQLFHFALQATQMLIRAHYGNAVQDPTSLAAHKGLLRRVWDVNSANYAAAKSLVQHSLIARILHIVMTIKGYENYKDLSEWDPTYQNIVELSEKIWKEWGSTRAAERAQNDHRDDWTAHEIYFIRDALLFIEFEHAVSHADPPRCLRIMRYWCLMFRGAGQHNYSRECAEILVVWKYELNDDLRTFLERSWFVNRSGLPGRWIAADLYLEQLNLLVKRIFIAKGNGVTIEYIISKGSACVEAFRRVSHSMATFFGDADRSRRSKEVSFQEDMRLLIEEMSRKGIHQGYKERLVPVQAKGKKSTKMRNKGVSAVVDIMVTGAEVWADKFTEFKRTTTYDPAVGYPIGQDTLDESDVRLDTGTVFDDTNRLHLDCSSNLDIGIVDDDSAGGLGGAGDMDNGIED